MTAAEASERRAAIVTTLRVLLYSPDYRFQRRELFGEEERPASWQMNVLRKLLKKGFIERAGLLTRPVYFLKQSFEVTDELVSWLMSWTAAEEFAPVAEESVPATTPIEELSVEQETPPAEPSTTLEMLAALVNALPLMIDAIARIERRMIDQEKILSRLAALWEPKP